MGKKKRYFDVGKSHAFLGCTHLSADPSMGHEQCLRRALGGPAVLSGIS